MNFFTRLSRSLAIVGGLLVLTPILAVWALTPQERVTLLASAGAAPTQVLINTLIASSSSTLSDTSSLTGSYPQYRLLLRNLKPATNGQCLQMTVSTNQGSSYLATGYTASAGGFNGSSADVDTATTLIPIGGTGTNSGCPQNGAAYPGVSGELWVRNPANGSSRTAIDGYVAYLASTGSTQLASIYGNNSTTSAINAIQFQFASGAIASGVIEIYGIP